MPRNGGRSQSGGTDKMEYTADTPEFERFRKSYDRQPPQLQCSDHELVQLAGQDGLNMLRRAPAGQIQPGSPPRSLEEKGNNTYLWVICDSGIPHIIERPLKGLDNRPPKHTNLTGGGKAYVGGELWFTDDRQLFLSGGSGRYPPRNEDELSDAANVFQSYQYQVTSLGWDYEYDRAKRIYDGD